MGKETQVVEESSWSLLPTPPLLPIAPLSPTHWNSSAIDPQKMPHTRPRGSAPGVERSDGTVATLQTQEQRLATLIERIVHGDQQALSTLYDATSAYVYGLAVRIVQDQAAAEDVTIEVYTQIQQHASYYDASLGTPSAWLLMLTRSRALDRRRRESLRQQREEPLEVAASTPSAVPTPEEWSTERDIQRAVQSALALLRPEQRQVIKITYYEGLSHSEIAAKLGQPLGTVKTRIRTAMVALRDLLSPLIALEAPQRRAAATHGSLIGVCEESRPPQGLA